jgi:hypothetical protein
MHARFGQLLSRMVSLSDHDIAEILEDQSSSRRRFGEIAIAWGLCQPQHIWRAWAKQCAQDQKRIDLSRCGIDAQAVALLSPELAERLTIIPLRSFEDEVIIATASPVVDESGELARHLHKQCSFVIADPIQIKAAIRAYYYAA